MDLPQVPVVGGAAHAQTIPLFPAWTFFPILSLSWLQLRLEELSHSFLTFSCVDLEHKTWVPTSPCNGISRCILTVV